MYSDLTLTSLHKGQAAYRFHQSPDVTLVVWLNAWFHLWFVFWGWDCDVRKLIVTPRGFTFFSRNVPTTIGKILLALCVLIILHHLPYWGGESIVAVFFVVIVILLKFRKWMVVSRDNVWWKWGKYKEALITTSKATGPVITTFSDKSTNSVLY